MNPPSLDEAKSLLEPLLRLHARIRDAVVSACERQEPTDLASVAGDEPDGGDTIYAVDKISEALLIKVVTEEIATRFPVVLVAEGLAGGRLVLPLGSRAEDARFRLIVDPIDGTRGLMYQKRSAWILTGVAPERGDATNLRDILVAVQTEIPLVKQHLCDTLWAVKGEGASGQRTNRLNGQVTPLHFRPSRADSTAHGFATISRFFPGGRDLLAAVDDDLATAHLGPAQPGRALCFEDQYISTGGQLYELIVGHDRFVADLRPLLAQKLQSRGWPASLCCHPYDLCTELIAREVGVVITDEQGRPPSHRLVVEEDVAWVGYANATLQGKLQPLLHAALQQHGLGIPA